MKSLKLYYISDHYINYLRKYDEKVLYNKTGKRPYVGIVYVLNSFNYFAPLSSPKAKHRNMNPNALDIFKIDGGNLGVVNLNNMIPTPSACLTEALPLVEDKLYKALLENQLTYLNRNKNRLAKKINFFQEKYRKGILKSNIMNRCCDFSLLEQKCLEYEKIKQVS